MSIVNIQQWRKQTRQQLLAKRNSLTVKQRQKIQELVMVQVRDLLSAIRPSILQTIGIYWPIKSELDLRSLISTWAEQGHRMALPVVEVRAAPLVYRLWQPGDKLVRGVWNIPCPVDSARTVMPDVVIAPLVGWDSSGYRLGYGGGYFDRTLASMETRPIAIGVGFHDAKLRTIIPQQHDIPMSVVITEQGLQYLDNTLVVNRPD